MGFDYLPVRCPSLPLIYRLPVDQQEDASHHAQTYVLEGGLFMVFVQRVVVIFDSCCSLSVLTGR